MRNRFNKFSQDLKDNKIYFKNRNAKAFIDKYNFIDIKDNLDLSYNEAIFNNFKESNLVIINQEENPKLDSDNEFFIISFHNTLLIIEQSSLHFIKSLFSSKKEPKICFLSSSKENFDKKIEINYQEIECDQEFEEEIYRFNCQIITNNIIFINSIIAYLIKQSYSKLNNFRIQNFFDREKNIFHSKILDREDFISLREIGHGSSFSTHLVYHIKKVELFVMKKPVFLNTETKDLIYRQEKNCSTVSHPFLPYFYGISKEDDFVIMEYIKGKTLTNIENMHLNFNEKITIIFELMIVISYLHENDFIYRDLKPDNIIIDDTKTLVLIDFDRMIFYDNNFNIRAHTIIDSYCFSAPEIDKNSFSNKCDIYSIGKLIYFILTEKYPSHSILEEIADFGKNYEIAEIYKQCLDEDENKRPTISTLIEKFYKIFNSNIEIDRFLKYSDFHFKDLLLFNQYVEIKNNNFYQDNKEEIIFAFEDRYLKPLFVENYIYVDINGNYNPARKLFNIGYTYYDKEKGHYDIDKAIHYFILSANLNDKIAQFYLGVIYSNQQNPSFNIDKAIYYYNLASNQDEYQSQYNLGRIYSDKQFNKYDINKAIHYFTLSANNKFAEAQYQLGYLYNSDDPSIHDINNAIKYYTLAAKQNHVSAQHNLGLMYYIDKNGTRNINKAIYYLSLSGNQNNAESLFTLGEIYYFGRYIRKNVDKAIHYLTRGTLLNHDKSMDLLGYIYYNEVPRDVNKAIYYFTLASKLNNSESQFSLGLIYFKIDIKKSIYYYTLSANNGNEKAQINLSFILLKGKYIRRNVNKALYYLNAAANKNCSLAQYNLGNIYSKGKYVKCDIQSALYYYTLAANQNNPRAQNNLGTLYCDVLKNKKKAFDYFTLAANQNIPQAQTNLALFYYKGKYVKKDIKKAIDLLTKASNQNYLFAQYQLGFLYQQKNEVHDINKSIYYYKLAADQNYTLAQLLLGDILLNSNEIKRNTKLGFYYLVNAANNKNIQANFIVGCLFHEGNAVECDIKKAIYYYKEASSFNYKFAKNNLGVIYKNGFGSEILKNIGYAVQYFEEAILQKNDELSIYNLSKIFLFEEKNVDKAIDLLIKYFNVKMVILDEIICFALVLKYGIDYEKIKNELDKYPEKSTYLLESIHETIKKYHLYNKSNFKVQYKFYEQNDYIYNHSFEIIQLSEIYSKKNLEMSGIMQMQQNINHEFYEGFGI